MNVGLYVPSQKCLSSPLFGMKCRGIRFKHTLHLALGQVVPTHLAGKPKTPLAAALSRPAPVRTQHDVARQGVSASQGVVRTSRSIGD